MANRSLTVLDYGLHNTTVTVLGRECDSDTCRNSWIAMGAGAVIGFFGLVILLRVALRACGFTSAGVSAGSCAAACQTPDTKRGGLFASAQSVGATGLGCLVTLALGILGGCIGGISGYMVYKTVSGCEEPYCK